MSEHELQVQCPGCETELSEGHVKCSRCGTYRADVQELLTYWWTVKITEFLVIVLFLSLASMGFWTAGAESTIWAALTGSALFWCLLGGWLLLALAGVLMGRKLHQITGASLYRWLP